MMADVVLVTGEMVTGELIGEDRIVYNARGGVVIEDVAHIISTRPSVNAVHYRAAIAAQLAEAKRWDSTADDLFDVWDTLEAAEPLSGPAATSRLATPNMRPTPPTAAGWLVD
jgi:hypothetical protein